MKVFILLLVLSSGIMADDKTNLSQIDQEFINISSNWKSFRDLISKPDSDKGESEYENLTRKKLIELTDQPHKELIESATNKDQRKRIQAIQSARLTAPLINIWTEEWKRAIELRKIQADIQAIGDRELNDELATNLENSINIRKSQLELLEHNQKYTIINEKVTNRTKQILDLQKQTISQAQKIEELQKQLAEAQKQVQKTKAPVVKKETAKPANKKKPQGQNKPKTPAKK